MSQKITNDEGEEIEVFTAEEVQAQVTAASTAKEAELTPKITTLETELSGAKTALASRANEFAQFRKLSDEQVAQLTEKDRIIYENGLALADANEKRLIAEKATLEATIDGSIKAKAGDNKALADKMKEMWPIINVEAVTPEQIEAKTQMILGAISTTQPDLVATANGFMGGTFIPPITKTGESKAFGDTPEGKAGAAELGLVIEPPKAS